MIQTKTFTTYVHKLLKNVDEGTHITLNAVHSLDGILRSLATNLCDNAQLLTQGTEKKTLSSNEIRSSVLATFPKNLATSSVAFAEHAVKTFGEDSDMEKTEEKSAPKMRESRAGLIFSVSLAEKYVRGFGQIKYNVSASAPVFLAAVLQHFTEKLFVPTCAVCQDSNRKSIKIRHIYLAIQSDSDLNSLINHLGVVILGGGVVPFVHSELLPVNKKRKPVRTAVKKESDTTSVAGTEAGTKRQHRWRPGTVALREIRQQQKSDNLLIQRAPFQRLVRDVANADASNLRFTANFMLTFQELIERDLVNMLADANAVAIHANRETVKPADVDLVVAIRDLPNSVQSVAKEDESAIPDAAITKLCYRSGIKRLSLTCKPRLQGYLRSLIAHYLHYVLVCTEHNERKTVNTRFLLEGLSMCGVRLATVPEKRKLRKKREEDGDADDEEDGGEYNPEAEENSADDSDEETVQPVPAPATVQPVPAPATVQPVPAPEKKPRGRAKKNETPVVQPPAPVVVSTPVVQPPAPAPVEKLPSKTQKRGKQAQGKTSQVLARATNVSDVDDSDELSDE